MDMTAYSIKRRSHCAVCGRRLSSRTDRGEIRWQPSQIDDKGIVCVPCSREKGKGVTRRTVHA